jgi:hypothetical protein
VSLTLFSKIIKECRKRKIWSITLSSIFIDSDIIESEYNGRPMVCHRVNNSFDLSYSNLSGKKKFKFKEGDIIQKINNVDFNSDGTIHHTELGFNIELFTYFMFETLFGSFVTLEMYRLDDNNEYKKQSYVITGISIESVYNIHMCNSNNYFIWKKCVFAELSDELITELLGEELLPTNIYSNKTLKENNSKLTIVFDGKTIKIVDKIGNKKIHSLKDIKSVSSSENKLTFTCKNFSGGTTKVVL